MRQQVLAGALALAVTLGACSDGDDSDEARQDLVDAFTLTDEESGGLSVEDRSCVAESQVDAVGVDAFEEAGVTPQDVEEAQTTSMAALGIETDEDDGQAFYENLSGCLDVRELFITGMSGGAEVPPDVKACLDENIDEGAVQEFVVMAFMAGEEGLADSPDVQTQLTEAIGTCSEQLSGTTTSLP